jgi:hypothetical protein
VHTLAPEAGPNGEGGDSLPGGNSLPDGNGAEATPA